MSMDRPEQYPEVSSEESGIVPQDGPRADWPKKIRMLSANELDRLTIDSAGRFYWDGRLVNYEAMQQQRAERVKVDPLDRNAFELLDRAALELSDRGQTDTAGPAVSHPSTGTTRPSSDIRAVDLDAFAAPPVAPPVPPVTSPANVVPAEHPALIAPAVRAPSDKVRVSLSGWQSIGVFLLVIGLLLGASGLAAHGFVAAHAWGCRIGLVTQYCPPPPPAPVVPPRPDIPA
jgi:hypothetical protein